VTPCSLGVKWGMVREWVAGKTVWSPCYTRAIYASWQSAINSRLLYLLNPDPNHNLRSWVWTDLGTNWYGTGWYQTWCTWYLYLRPEYLIYLGLIQLWLKWDIMIYKHRNAYDFNFIIGNEWKNCFDGKFIVLTTYCTDHRDNNSAFLWRYEPVRCTGKSDDWITIFLLA